MPEGMIISLVVLLHDSAAAGLTALGCWLALRRHHKPGWYLALVGAVAVPTFEILFPDGGYVFHPERFEYSKTSPSIELQKFLFSILIAIIPTVLVVYYFRKKCGNHEEPTA